MSTFMLSFHLVSFFFFFVFTFVELPWRQLSGHHVTSVWDRGHVMTGAYKHLGSFPRQSLVGCSDLYRSDLHMLHVLAGIAFFKLFLCTALPDLVNVHSLGASMSTQLELGFLYKHSNK